VSPKLIYINKLFLTLNKVLLKYEAPQRFGKVETSRKLKIVDFRENNFTIWTLVDIGIGIGTGNMSTCLCLFARKTKTDVSAYKYNK
ncbi:MAG: hypothetical protein ACTS6A_01295, partial [Candidatus Hodgkinia cicadicola]